MFMIIYLAGEGDMKKSVNNEPIEKIPKIKILTIFTGFTIMLSIWILFFATFLIAFFNGGRATININKYGEAMFELFYSAIITIFVLITYYLLIDILLINKKREKTLLMKIEQLSSYDTKYKLLMLILGAFIGLSFTEQVLILIGRKSFFVAGIHFHHLYIGIIGLVVIFIIYYFRKHNSDKISLTLIIIMGFCLGIIMHGLYLSVLEGKYNIFFTFEDLFWPSVIIF